MAEVRQRFGVSERRACRVLGQARTTQRRRSNRSADEEALREDVVKVARRFGRYGYRMVTGMLEDEGCWPGRYGLRTIPIRHPPTAQALAT